MSFNDQFDAPFPPDPGQQINAAAMPRAAAPWIVRLFVLIGCIALGYVMVTNSLVAHLAMANPDWALSINEQHRGALLGAANQSINRVNAEDDSRRRQSAEAGQDAASEGARENDEEHGGDQREQMPALSPAERSAIVARSKSQVRNAITAAPINSSAMRMLGQLAILEDDQQRAKTYMRFARKLSRRENVAAAWLLERNLETGNYDEALAITFELFEVHLGLDRSVAPIVGLLAETPGGIKKVAEKLAQNPRWRLTIIKNMYRGMQDARTPFELFSRLKKSEFPPVQEELNSYFDFLFGIKQYDLAYYVWLQFLPPNELSEIGLIYNHDFAKPPNGSPYDWRRGKSVGATIEYGALRGEAGGKRRRGVRVELNGGRIEFGDLTQYVVLSPGKYDFSTKVKANLNGVRGFRWRVKCQSQSKPLAVGPMSFGRHANWETYTFRFEVPRTGCPSQTVELFHDARSESEMLLSGAILYEFVSLVRQQRQLTTPAPDNKSNPDPSTDRSNETPLTSETGASPANTNREQPQN